MKRHKGNSAVAILMLGLAALACNLGDRLKPAPKAAKSCFADTAGNQAGEKRTLTSEEGGFTVTLPAGFPEPSPPEPIYNRYLLTVARGRVYQVQFSSEVKADLDHPVQHDGTKGLVSIRGAISLTPAFRPVTRNQTINAVATVSSEETVATGKWKSLPGHRPKGRC